MRFRTIYELAEVVNRMKPGERLDLDIVDMSDIRWNDLLYGRGFDGFSRALRGNVIGSSFGTCEVREYYGPSSETAVTIIKHEEGERIYDRDGYPVRKPAEKGAEG